MMPSRIPRIIIALALLMPAAATALAAGELGDVGATWIVDEMIRVGPEDPAGTTTSISLEAARGEYVAFQPVVRANTGPLNNVRVTASALVGPGTISPENIEVYRESFLALPTSTPHQGTSKPLPPGTYPDGLIPTKNPAEGTPIPPGAPLRAQNHTISAGETQPYWVDVFIPRTASPGGYKGTITIQAEEGTSTLEVDLTVWRFTLPTTPSLKSSFGVWARPHNKQDYIELMKHRLMPVADASIHGDLKALGMSVGDLNLYSGANVSNCSMSPPPSPEDLRAVKSSQPSGLDLYNFTADEIGECKHLMKKLKQWSEALHSVGVKQLITMPPRLELYGSVDIWVMLPGQFVEERPDLAAVKAAGGEIWSYTSMNQDSYSPKWQIDFSPMNHRIYGLLNQSVGATGLLYWTVDYWTSDPWTNPYSWQGSYPGDGVLVYPGDKVGLSTVVPSMRLKYIRSAVQDYEYVELLSKADRRDWALETIRPIARNWQHWSDDPKQLRAVRHSLAVELDRVTADGT
jgi:Glycoside hydrolase 123, catalytic domain/Glycoside hydrolase 123 N-terminal domain